MAILRAVPYECFAEEIGNRRIICFGAGITLGDIFKFYSDRLHILSRTDVVLDNNIAHYGTTREIYNRQIPVKTVPHFLSENPILSDYVIVLCSTNYTQKMMEQLDQIKSFDRTPCYLWKPLVEESRLVASPAITSISYDYNKYNIPKTIHYCWFGGKEMPARERACIDSWKKYCPDYDIILWNENSFDIEKNEYMKEAYRAKKWGFVPDFARFDIIYEHGGFYLDTDVELVKGLDHFAHFKAFFAFEWHNLINPGSGFGSVPNNPLLKDLRNLYMGKKFINDDKTLNLTSSPIYTTEFFREKGVEINNQMQIVNDTVFLPSDFFSPVNQLTTLYELTANTHAIHKFSCSWFEAEPLREWEDLKQANAAMNDRLLHDYKFMMKI